jgi:hypothetical protein
MKQRTRICGGEDYGQGCFRYFAADITGATSKLDRNQGDDAEGTVATGIFRGKQKSSRTVVASSGEEVIFYIEQHADQGDRYRLIAITPYIRSDSFSLVFVTDLQSKEAALATLFNVGEKEAHATLLQAREDGRDAA